MSNLNKEIRNVQNPVLGAYLIWNFVRGYYTNNSNPVPLPLLFIILPIILQEDMFEVLLHTNKPSGLRYYVGKFSTPQQKKNDMITQIQTAALNMKSLSLDSIRIAVGASLITIEYETSLVLPLSTSGHRSEPKNIVKLGKSSEKLGYWFSQLTMHEISRILKVRF